MDVHSHALGAPTIAVLVLAALSACSKKERSRRAT